MPALAPRILQRARGLRDARSPRLEAAERVARRGRADPRPAAGRLFLPYSIAPGSPAPCPLLVFQRAGGATGPGRHSS